MLKKFFKYVFIAFIFSGVAVVAFIGAVQLNLFGYLYTEEDLKGFKNENASLILSEDGRTLGKIFDENRTNISFEDLPEHLIHALIATEDVRYFEHEGVDSKGLLRVLVKSIIMQKKSAGGGSTISQQLVKNMYGRESFGFLTMPINKTKEAILAVRIENIYNKQEILALYFNTIPFGENVYGIEAASRRFYNKNVNSLTLDESAVLVGLLKANTYYNPRLYPEHSKARRNVVLAQMAKYHYISEKEKEEAQELPIALDYANLSSEGVANYFLEHIKKQSRDLVESYNKTNGTEWNLKTDGLVIRTTLNYRLQKHALNAFEKHLKKMQGFLRKQYESGSSRRELNELLKKELKRNNLSEKAQSYSTIELFNWSDSRTDSILVKDSLAYYMTQLHAGLMAIDPNTGEVRAYVGGVDFRKFPYDQIRARRQMASSFKPILYAAAIEEGFTPCTYLDNSEMVFTDLNNWQPKNYDNTYGGEFSLQAALLKSKNVPTVNLFFNVGFENLDYLWEKMSFSSDLDNLPSTALGTASASIYEVAFAYAAFANGGYLVEPVSILSIKTKSGEVLYEKKIERPEVRILKDSTSKTMTAVLQKAIQRGTGVAIPKTYGIRHELAGKTGTSQNFSDAWFVSYNPNLVMVTRVGASTPQIHFNMGAYGSGSRLALPLAGLTWQAAQSDTNLNSKVFSDFPELSLEWQEQMTCDDFQESSKLEELLKKDKTSTKEKTKKGKKTREKKKKQKKSIFQRIFK